MKILLLGANGQIGWELRRALVALGEVQACGRTQAELGDVASLSRTVRSCAPDLIVNAAAYTDVDMAEMEPDTAWRINAEAVEVLAKTAHTTGAWLIHYSTDYVFDGSGEHCWREDDTPAPLNVYGQTKLAGEQAIRDSHCQHLIFRTSWIYAARRRNFARTILRCAMEQEQLRVVADQFGTPTSAALVADITALVYSSIRHDRKASRVSGTYHLTASGSTNWHDYACFLVSEASNLGAKLRTSTADILAISSMELKQAARRPANSRLDTTRLRHAFHLSLPPWQDQVSRLVTELCATDSQ